jgi:predicted metal-dependent phosphoesterase TrpH
MPRLSADLHLHTIHSDGLRTPEEVVRAAVKMGIDVIAISDHDNLGAVPVAAAVAQQLGALLIPAIELSTDFQGEDVHLLAYGVDITSPELIAKLEYFRDRRMRRGDLMVEKLMAQGIPIRRERVEELRGDASLGRPHIARALMELGVVKDMNDAFDRYLSPGGLGYVDTERIPLRDAIELVHRAGGIASLAHPTLNKGGRDLAEDAIAHGLDGIEVYHPDVDRDARLEYTQLARQHNILVTGGSDDHGFEGAKHMGTSRLVDPHLAAFLERLGLE